MKIIIALAALILAAAILTLTMFRTSSPAEKPVVPALNEQAQSQEAPAATAPSPREPARVANIAPPPTDPREQWLATLYESSSIADRLQAARQIAARGDEGAFRDLASFIAAAEATGDDTFVDVAAQVASVLGQMQGDEIQTIATEFAYSPSALVAEAAVNAAVAAEPGTTPQWVDSGPLQSPADKEALDAFVQQLWGYGGKPAAKPAAAEPRYK